MHRLYLFILLLITMSPLEMQSQEPYSSLADSQQVALTAANNHAERLDLFEGWINQAIKSRKPAQAMHLLTFALPLAQKTENDSAQIAFWIQKGRAYYQQLFRDSAKVAFREGLKIAHRIDDKESLSKILKNYGSTFIYETHRDSTLWYYQESLKYARETGNPIMEASRLNMLGLTHMHNGEYTEAEIYFLQALDIFKEAGGNKNYLSGMLYNLGNNASGADKREKAISYYKQALDIVREMKNRRREAVILSLIAYHYREKGNIPLSLDYYQQALDIVNEPGEPQWGTKIQCLKGIASVHESMENYLDALPYYQEVLTIINSGDDIRGLPRALYDMGDNYLKRGLYDSAIVYFKQGLQYPKVEQAFGDLYAGNGRAFESKNELDSAAYFFQLGLKHGREFKQFNLQAVCLSGLGRILDKQGQAKQARLHLLEAEKIALETGSPENQLEATRSLHQIFRDQKDFSLAYEYLEITKNLEDSLFNLKNTERLVRLQADAEFKQEKQKIAFKQAQENERQANFRRILWIGLGAAMLLALIFAWYFWQKQKANQKLQQLNEEIRSQKEVLEEQKEQLLELDNFKQDMTSMIVHDLKNPLNTIIGLSDGQHIEDHGKTIKQAGNSMLSLVMNILDVQKFEEAEVDLHLDSVGLRALIDKAIERVALLIEGKSLQVNVSIPAEIRLAVDAELIIRCFENLLTNSIKFTPIGKQISLYLDDEMEKDFAKVWIEDEGPGIRSDQVQHIFSKYRQDRKAHSGRAGSTGLGLTFCRMALEAHGGSIGVVPQENKGALFWLLLPLDRDAGKKQVEAVRNDSISIPSTNYQLHLSLEEKALFLDLIMEMQGVRIFQASQVQKLFEKIPADASNELLEWKAAVEQAVFHVNEVRFEELKKVEPKSATSH